MPIRKPTISSILSDVYTIWFDDFTLQKKEKHFLCVMVVCGKEFHYVVLHSPVIHHVSKCYFVP